MVFGVISQGTARLVAAKLDVKGQNLEVLLAKVFGEDAADFAVADKADVPVSGVG
jgi:hypothetical protein